MPDLPKLGVLMFNSKFSAKKIESDDNASEPDDNLSMKEHMRNKDLNKGLTMVYQEGSNYAVHKEDPDYYLMPIQAKIVANTYLKSLKDGETPHPDAIERMGIRQNRKGQWVYKANQSKIARTPTLGDYASIPLKNIHFSQNDAHGNQYTSIVTPGIRLGDGLFEPHNIIGPDLMGDLDQENKLPTFKAGQYTAKCNECHGSGCDGCNNGQKTYIADPLQAIGQAQQETENSYKNLIANGITDMKEYFKAGLKNSFRQHGRRVTSDDPLPEDATNKGSNWHGLPKGVSPYHLQLQIDPVVHNMANYHYLDTEPLPKQEIIKKRADGTTYVSKKVDPHLKKQIQNLLDDAPTSTFVKCNCPHDVINQSAQVLNQFYDVQHHNALASSEDEKVRKAYFTGFPVPNSDRFGSAKDMGKVAKRVPHRIVWATDSAQRLINHMVKFNKAEFNTPGFQLGRFNGPRFKNVPEINYAIDPESITAREF